MVGTAKGRNLDQIVAARGYEAQPSPAKQSQGETADAWVCPLFRKEMWQIIQVSNSRADILIGQFVLSEQIAKRHVSCRSHTLIHAIMAKRTRDEYRVRCATT